MQKLDNRTVLIADDHRIMRQGLRVLLEEKLGMKVVAEADNGLEAVRLAKKEQPDFVLMDYSMPEMNGPESTRRIVQALPKTRVVTLSMHTDRRFVYSMLDAGASAYLLKDSTFDEVREAIVTVAAGNKYVSPRIAGDILSSRNIESTTDENIANRLTPREREITKLVADGHSTAQIAKLLNLSQKTIESHRSKLMKKLGFSSVAQLIKFAIRNHLSSVNT